MFHCFFHFRCVASSSCNKKGNDLDFANAISERRGNEDNEDDWEETAVCDAPRDDYTDETFVRSDSDDEEKVCCKDENVQKKPSCSTIRDTHRFDIE